MVGNDRSGSTLADSGSHRTAAEASNLGVRTMVADAIVRALERAELRTFGDLFVEARLKAVASHAYSGLPLSARLIIGATCGQRVFEDALFEVLGHVRNRIPERLDGYDLTFAVRDVVLNTGTTDTMRRVYETLQARLGSLSGATLSRTVMGMIGTDRHSRPAVREAQAPDPAALLHAAWRNVG